MTRHLIPPARAFAVAALLSMLGAGHAAAGDSASTGHGHHATKAEAAGSAEIGDLNASLIWARRPLGKRPAAAYMHLESASEGDDALLAVSSTAFERIELHQTTEKDGVMSMAPVTEIPLPGKGSVTLRPGGYHLMLFTATAPLRHGDSFPLTLTFRDRGAVEIDVPVLKRPPKGMEKGMAGHMDHSGHSGHAGHTGHKTDDDHTGHGEHKKTATE